MNVADISNIKTPNTVFSDNGVLEFKLEAFSVDGFVSEKYNKTTEYSVDIPEKEIQAISYKYKEQLKVFQWLKGSEYNIAGVDLIRNQLTDAFEKQKFSKVRHILKSYVSSKTRKLFEANNL